MQNSMTLGNKNKGFTLIEVMIVVAIIAILASVALSSYKQYITKSNRAAAQAEMMDIANREEQFLLANRNYADKATLVANGYVLRAEVGRLYDYDVTIATDGKPTYLITFTGKAAQLGDGVLTLNSDGVKTPSNKW